MTQLSNRAFFDIYFLADIEYPRKLIEQGLGLSESEFRYAVGQIVVWAPDAPQLDRDKLGMEALKTKRTFRTELPMATALPFPAQPAPMDWTIADVQQRLDDIPAERIRTFPAPGTAKEEDVLRVMARTGRICELVDGILVEKVMSSWESRLAGILIYLIEAFLEDHDLGAALPGDGFLKLFPGLVRAPDVSFIRWERFPGDEFPADAIWPVAPDLAVEILSKGNTEREMQRKLREYFKGGASRVWIVDPKSRTVRIFTSPRRFTLVDEKGPLDTGNVLPGFELTLKDWFSRAHRRTPRRKKR